MKEILARKATKDSIKKLIQTVVNQKQPAKARIFMSRSDMTYGNLIFNTLRNSEITNPNIDSGVHFYGVTSLSSCIRINTNRIDLDCVKSYTNEFFGEEIAIENSTISDIGLSLELRKHQRINEFINKILKG